MPASVTVLTRDGQDAESVDLPAAEPTVFGRDPGEGIQLDHSEVSRRHFEIARIDGRWHITDLGSTNGTFLAGQRVIEAELKDGQVIAAGKGRLRFNCEQGAANEPTEDVPAPSVPVGQRTEQLERPELGPASAVISVRAQDVVAPERPEGRTHCPRCGILLVLPDRARGKPVRCATCGGDFAAEQHDLERGDGVDGGRSPADGVPEARELPPPAPALVRPQEDVPSPIWCAEGSYPTPALLGAALEHDTETAAPVIFAEHALHLAPVPRNALLRILAFDVMQLLLTPVYVLATAVLVSIHVLALFPNLVSPMGFAFWCMNSGFLLNDILMLLWAILVRVLRVVEILLSLLGWRTFFYKPSGMAATGQILTALSPERPVQLVHLNLPIQYVRKQQKRGGLAAMLARLPLALGKTLLRLLFRAPKPEHTPSVDVLLVVEGKPVDLVEPEGRQARRKRKLLLNRPGKRSIFRRPRSRVLALCGPPEAIRALGVDIAERARVDVVEADEEFVSSRLWIE